MFLLKLLFLSQILTILSYPADANMLLFINFNPNILFFPALKTIFSLCVVLSKIQIVPDTSPTAYSLLFGEIATEDRSFLSVCVFNNFIFENDNELRYIENAFVSNCEELLNFFTNMKDTE